jgi:2-polyprenyl-3-methyl-5-hydroxy-6-metoxy-1,4-benzoquinol methylase
MTATKPDGERDLVADVRRIWDAKAAFWDDRMGDGNDFERQLIGPAIEGLLGVRPGELVLDVGCGTGVNARRLARLGAQVVAIDYSEVSLGIARGRETDDTGSIDYRLVDATDYQQLIGLGRGRFAAVVSSMVLMDMPLIEPLLRATARLLVPEGRFVFTVLHPAFNSIAATRCVEIVTSQDGREIPRHAINVTQYLNVPAGKGTGMLGEPEPHWYFHRPLHALFGACFAAGFVLDGLEEPMLTPGETDPRSLSWSTILSIPPVLAARFILRDVPARSDRAPTPSQERI